MHRVEHRNESWRFGVNVAPQMSQIRSGGGPTGISAATRRRASSMMSAHTSGSWWRTQATASCSRIVWRRRFAASIAAPVDDACRRRLRM